MPEAYTSHFWVIFENTTSIDTIKHASTTQTTDSLPPPPDDDFEQSPSENSINISRSSRARSPRENTEQRSSLGLKLRVPAVPRGQMKDGGVSLTDLLPYVSRPSMSDADSQSGEEKSDAISKLMDVEGALPEGWRDVHITIEPASTSIRLSL